MSKGNMYLTAYCSKCEDMIRVHRFDLANVLLCGDCAMDKVMA